MSEPKKIVRLAAVKPAQVLPAAEAGGKPDALPAEGPAVPRAPVSTGTGIVAGPLMEGACPKCGKVVSLASAAPLSDTTCPGCGATFMAPGRLDSFILLERIGVGEMGEIYRARDESLDREVAIKVVLAGRAEEKSLHERLSREARAAARLSHPRVAQVHALGFSNGHPYLVMELVRGEDMDVKLRREGRIDERVVMRVADEVTEGLQALHREGLTHGDIKPANIILDREGAAKLVDFGLSGMSRNDGNRAIVGTPQYIAPETLRGIPDNSQTDLYSLGATLYHLLCGKPPFDGPTPAEVARARLVRPADPIGQHVPNLAQGTQRLVMRMLEADPFKRYRDCTAALADIREARKRADAAALAMPGNPVPGTPAGSASTGTPAIMPAVAPSFTTGTDGVVQSLKSSLKAAVKAETAPSAVPAPKTAAPRTAPRPRARLAIAILVVLVLAGGSVAFYAIRAKMLEPSAVSAAVSGETPPVNPASGNSGQYSPVLNPSLVEKTSPEPAAVLPVKAELKGFPRILAPRWMTSGFGQTGRGSTFWHNGTLLLQGEGFNQEQERDIFRFHYTAMEGDFAVSVQLVSAARTHDMAKTGLLVGENTGELGASLFFGRLGDGTLLFQTRENGALEQAVRISPGPVVLPCYLQIVRRNTRFVASTSSDGVWWLPFGECSLALPGQTYLGVGVSAGRPGVVASAEFRDLALRGPEAPLPSMKTN